MVVARVGLLLTFIALMLMASLTVAQDATQVPTVTESPVTVSPSPSLADALPILISARSDLELLATSKLGTSRPTGWSGSMDINDPHLAILIRLDLELLAGESYSVDSRPEGWFGAVPSTNFAIARDIRHDLELLADALVQPGVRPPGWTGADPLMRCNRATQTLVNVLSKSGYALRADPNSAAFCQQAEIETSQYIERTSLNTGIAAPGSISAGNDSPVVVGVIEASTLHTIAFLDRKASKRAGLIPQHTSMKPVARSYAAFSTMMVVQGDNFQVYVDYTATSMSQASFAALPNVDTLPITLQCGASWCGK